jgi:hypothetical protein
MGPLHAAVLRWSCQELNVFQLALRHSIEDDVGDRIEDDLDILWVVAGTGPAMPSADRDRLSLEGEPCRGPFLHNTQ